jgi:hypothetical protein
LKGKLNREIYNGGLLTRSKNLNLCMHKRKSAGWKSKEKLTLKSEIHYLEERFVTAGKGLVTVRTYSTCKYLHKSTYSSDGGRVRQKHVI